MTRSVRLGRGQSEQIAKSRIELGEGKLGSGSATNDDQVDVLRELTAVRPKPGAQPTLETIPDDRVSDLAAGRDPDAAF